MDLYELNRLCLLHIVTIKLVRHYFDSISTMNVGGMQTRSIVEQIESVTQKMSHAFLSTISIYLCALLPSLIVIFGTIDLGF
jgi:hypothetical protein